MWTGLSPQPGDKILSLIEAFRDDPRDAKIDLGVGVYRNAQGVTPVMSAVKSAEQRIWERQTTKSYTVPTGDPAFADAMIKLVLGSSVARERLATLATPGGTGAIRQGLELIRMAHPGATIWLPAPTWPVHLTIPRYLGLAARTYRYFDEASRNVDFGGLLADLGKAGAGDVVVLHGCCHNPTGANLLPDQWDQLIGVLARQGAVPFIDLAYQGFGDGLMQDAAATRQVASSLPETLIAVSCSKTFGLYRERTGLLICASDTTGQRDLVQGNLGFLNRQAYSFPPDHGARVVTAILNDPDLRAAWRDELEATRQNLNDLRGQLAEALRQRSNSDRFDFIARHRGMFSKLGASPGQVADLRRTHGIYMVEDSRMNMAGLTARTVPILAQAIVDTGI